MREMFVRMYMCVRMCKMCVRHMYMSVCEREDMYTCVVCVREVFTML